MKPLRTSAALVLLLGLHGFPVHAQDNAQLCMFQCAPKLGTSTYDQCLSDCFSEGSEDTESSERPDISDLHGFWQTFEVPCGTMSDMVWDIDERGASGYEGSCTVQSLQQSDSSYTLHQICEYGDSWEMTVTMRLLGSDEMMVDDRLYRRCR